MVVRHGTRMTRMLRQALRNAAELQATRMVTDFYLFKAEQQDFNQLNQC
jgi:hypothetical protein